MPPKGTQARLDLFLKPATKKFKETSDDLTESRWAFTVSHVHQDILDRIDIMELAAEFAHRSQTRMALFGRGHWWPQWLLF